MRTLGSLSGIPGMALDKAAGASPGHMHVCVPL